LFFVAFKTKIRFRPIEKLFKCACHVPVSLVLKIPNKKFSKKLFNFAFVAFFVTEKMLFIKDIITMFVVFLKYLLENMERHIE
jgi:hypothetical protein